MYIKRTYKIIPLKRNKFAVAALLFFLISTLASCSLKGAVEKCSFKADKISIKDLTNDGFKAVVTFKIKNPNWVGLNVDKIEYSILVNKEELGSGKTEERVLIPGRSKSTVNIPVEVRMTGLSGSLFKFLVSGKIEYRIKGKAVFSTLFGNVEYPFDLTKKINPFKS